MLLFAVAFMAEQQVLKTYLLSKFHTCQSNRVGNSLVNDACYSALFLHPHFSIHLAGLNLRH